MRKALFKTGEAQESFTRALNNITNNGYGICLENSSNHNIIVENNITNKRARSFFIIVQATAFSIITLSTITFRFIPATWQILGIMVILLAETTGATIARALSKRAPQT